MTNQDLADKVARIIECYAASYEMMARISDDGTVQCSDVAIDLRRNVLRQVRAAIYAEKSPVR